MPKCCKCLKPMPGSNGLMLCRMCKGKAAVLKASPDKIGRV